MELKHIKELMAAMGRTGTKKMMLKKEDFELLLERDDATFVRTEGPFDLHEESPYRMEMADRANAAFSKGREHTLSLATGAATTAPKETASQKEEPSLYVTSPMVGTFYLSPTPESASFVKVGDRIEKNTVVCIIEAMKVMNEVKAGVAGIVTEILAEDGHPVEFGSKLFRIS